MFSIEEKKAINIIRNYLNINDEIWTDEYVMNKYDFVVSQIIENSKIVKFGIKSVSEGNQSISYNSIPWTVTDDIKALLPMPFVKTYW